MMNISFVPSIFLFLVFGLAESNGFLDNDDENEFNYIFGDLIDKNDDSLISINEFKEFLQNSDRACDFSEKIQQLIKNSNKECALPIVSYSSITSTTTETYLNLKLKKPISTATTSQISTTIQDELKYDMSTTTTELANNKDYNTYNYNDNLTTNNNQNNGEYDLIDFFLGQIEHLIKRLRESSKKNRTNKNLRYLIRNS